MSLPSSRTITRTVVVPAPPEETWDALVDPDRLEDWFADSVEGELEPDGEVAFSWEDGERREAIVEVVQAPTRLTFWWWREGDERGTRVSFELAPAVGGTRVVVSESGLSERAIRQAPRLAAACSLVLA